MAVTIAKSAWCHKPSVWIVIGAVYAALGDNLWLKEQACEMLSSRHNH
jgi:hypothetical protein